MNYRKIYEQHHGPIPKGFEIHHVDGNRKNNRPSNLKAVSIYEHYNIHWKQGDYGACFKIAMKMEMNPKDFSRLMSLSNKKRLNEGTHHLLSGKIQRDAALKRLKDGTHNFIGINQRRIKDGTHHLLGPKTNKKRVESGTHNWQNPKTYTCPCGKIGKGPVMFRYHFNNCKELQNG